jgi:hypothetical protein
MKKHKYVVPVPKPHPKAYNPDRPITDLVRNQILHLSLAERHLDKRHRTGVDVYSIQTERQASEYIHHLTKRLHPEGVKPPRSGKKSSRKPATTTQKIKKAKSGRK